MQLAAPFRLRARAIAVVAMALALVLGTLAAPARAGEDLESARSAALETVNQKINSLKEYREGTTTDAAWAVYTEGIEELGGIKERILEEDNVFEINALKSQAVAVWSETKERAADTETDDGAAYEEAREAALAKINARLGHFREKRNNTDNADYREIYAWAIGELEDLWEAAQNADTADELWELKGQAQEIYEAALAKINRLNNDDDDESHDKEADDRRKRDDDKRHEEEEAEASVAEARDRTLALIDKKVRLLKAASQSSNHPQVSDIYYRAATAVAELRGEAEAAETIDQLEGIADQVWDIIHAAKTEIAAYRPGHDKDGDGEDDHEPNGELTDKQIQDDRGDEGTTDDREESSEEEEQTISSALDALEAETLANQQLVANTIDPISGTLETGQAALAAGDDLLAAIRAARLAETEEDIIAAWEAVMAAKNAYRLALIAHNNVAGGIFAASAPLPN